jgi:hypothetical protein
MTRARPVPTAPWRPLTRRAFVAALATAAAALAIKDRRRGLHALGDGDDDRPRRHSTTVWIGHC